MKYICRGHWLYYPSTLFSDPVDYYEKALRRDFKIKADVNLKDYELQHVVNLFEKESDGRISSYIAGETLILQKRYTLGINICLFPAVTVYRCHPVADFQDIIKYFGRYLNAKNRFDLDFLLAKQITKIDEINAYFDWLCHNKWLIFDEKYRIIIVRNSTTEGGNWICLLSKTH